MRYRGNQVHVGYYRNDAASSGTYYLSIQGNTVFFVLNTKILLGFLSVFTAFVLFSMIQAPRQAFHSPNEYRADVEDAVGYVMDEESAFRTVGNNSVQNLRDGFTVNKQLLISKYLIENKVSRIDQLNNQELLALNQKISDLYTQEVLPALELPEHVMSFFTDVRPLKKIETALMEQAKFNVPASIKLAQAALETAYGQRVIHNNYFGIKDKAGKTKLSETIEYYTDAEYQLNKHKVIASEKIYKGGKQLYKCRIKDHFSSYSTPWESFRAHSKFLSESSRYAPLFTKGRDFREWAKKIGSTKYGGVGYATSPIYGEMLINIIERYHLDLLDH